MNVTNSLLMPILCLSALMGCSVKNIDSASKPGQTNKGLIVGTITQTKPEGISKQIVNYYLAARSGNSLTGRARIASRVEKVKALGLGFKPSEFTDVEGRLFAIEMAPGNYDLVSWALDAGTFTLSPKEKPPAIKVSVKKGQVTYIGNLHTAIRFGKNVFQFKLPADAVANINDKSARDLSRFRKRYPYWAQAPVNRLESYPGLWVSGEQSGTKKRNDPIPIPANTQ